MSERPYLTVPGGVWLRDPALNGCREDSIAIFHAIAEASNRDWRIEVAPGSHAFSVRQCFRDPTRFRRWSEERIDRALAELRARGCLLLATANDREWLEVPDRLSYCKGHKPEAGLGAPQQVPLALPGEMPLFGVVDGGGLMVDSQSRNGGRRGSAPAARIAVRAEKRRKEQDHDSPSPKAAAAERGFASTRGPRLRDESSGGSLKEYPRWIEDRDGDAVWKDLCLLMGREEMTQNGDMWMRRMDIRTDLIETLLREVNRQELAGVVNRGSWFTTIFEERRKLWA